VASGIDPSFEEEAASISFEEATSIGFVEATDISFVGLEVVGIATEVGHIIAEEGIVGADRITVVEAYHHTYLVEEDGT